MKGKRHIFINLFVLGLSLLILGCGKATDESSDAGTNWLTTEMETSEFAAACAETPGCDQAQEPAQVPTESVWRVQVVRDTDHTIRIESFERIAVAAGTGVPVGALHSEYALIGLNAQGQAVDGQAIRFPTEMRFEFENRSDVQRIGLESAVDTIGYVRALPSIVRLVVKDTAGNILRSVDVPTDMTWDIDPDRLLGIEAAHAATQPFQGLSPQCAHVVVIQGEFQRHLAVGMEFEKSITLVRPGPYQLAATRAALERLTPMLCQSIGRIAFGHVPESVVPGTITGAVASASAGDLVVINVAGLVHEVHLQNMISRRLMLQKTVTHEAGHAAETLLTYEGANRGSYSGEWGVPGRALADETIRNVRLEIGLPEEWQRLHKSFVDRGWARPHGSFPVPEEGEPPAPWGAKDVVHGGFISQYSSRKWEEDIGDYIGWAYLSRPYTDSYAEHNVSDALREDLGCLIMRKYGDRNLPSHYAAVYTKLHFLQDLGLVRPEDVKDCTGDALGLHIGEEGFHVWQEGVKRRSFKEGLKARLGTADFGAKIFELSASGGAEFGGETYPADVNLQLDLGRRFIEIDKVAWPRGIYPLSLRGGSHFTLRLDGAAAGNFDAMDGFALVAEASNKRIAGSVVLQRVYRLSAPLPVPERYDPPLVVRFLIEK